MSYKIDFKSSNFNNVVCYETVDINLIDNLLNSDLLLKTFSDKNRKNIYDNEKKQLIEYRKLIKNNRAKITYVKSEGKNYGRCLPVRSLGLYNIRRQLRHTLTKDNYVDIDIVNCHPEILLQIAKNNNDNMPQLEYYVNNREKVLQLVMNEYKVDREASKHLFICILYFGTFKNWAKRNNLIDAKPLDIIKNLSKELKTVGNKIYNDNEILRNDSIEKKGNDFSKNIVGTCVSYYLQEIECQILESVYNYCKEKGYIKNNNCVLCADGIMLEKELLNSKSESNSLLSELEDLIKNKFNLILKFKEKEMNEGYNDILHEHIINNDSFDKSPVELHIEKKEEQKEKYQKMKEEFESEHCKIIEKYCYIKTIDDRLQVFTKKQLIEAYEHLIYGYQIEYNKLTNEFIENKDKPLYFINKWIKDPEIRKYNNIGVYPPPLKCPDNIFNTWLKFKLDDNNEYNENIEGLNKILNHFKILFNEEEDIYNYFIKWMAHMIQKPAEKIGKFPILTGKQGCGKSTIGIIMKKLIGDNKFLETTTPEEDVWGKFNGQMARAYLVNVNEVGKKNQEGFQGRIKGLITDETMNIQYKGKDSFEIPSYHRFFMTTNKNDPTYTDKDDRRNWIINCSEVLKNDHSYFKKLYEYINDYDTMKTFYNYLEELDIENFFNEKPPITEYHKNIMLENECPVKEFLIYFVQLNEKFDEVEYAKKDLFNLFLSFMEENKYNNNYSISSFFKKLYSVYNINFMKDIRVGKMKIRHKKINIKMLKNKIMNDEFID